MELDDLKEKWKASVHPSSSIDIRDALERKVSDLRRSGRGLRRVFMIELAVVLVMYIFVLLMTIFGSEKIVTYMYKIIAATLVFSVPVVVRLYKAQRWITNLDYSKDIRSNMIEFLAYYKNTLTLYKWATYFLLIVLLVLMFTDNNFVQLPMRFKVFFLLYCAAGALITEPYIRYAYGRKTAAFENFLRD